MAGERSLEFRMLGPLQVARSGRLVRLGGRQQRAVLAMLLAEANSVVPLGRLVAGLWGERPSGGAVQTVQTYVFHLRQALEPQRARGVESAVLVTADRGYLLRADRSAVDAAVFEARLAGGRAALDAGRYAEAAAELGGALRLWRGEVLADVAEYEFARVEAARLGELRLAALEARIDADLALGRHAMVTAELERLVADHPLRERLHSQLVLALYRCGRQADALVAYRRARDLLAGELGIDPGEPLQRLHASVLAHDPALEWAGSHDPAGGHRAGAGAPAVSPPSAPSALRPTDSSGGPALGRRRARRLLAAGSALAVAAAVSIVVAARPWAQAQASLPANTVGLIDFAGGRAGRGLPTSISARRWLHPHTPIGLQSGSARVLLELLADGLGLP